MKTIQILTAIPHVDAQTIPRMGMVSYLIPADDIAQAWKVIETQHGGRNAYAAYGFALTHLTPENVPTSVVIDDVFDMEYEEFMMWVKLTVAGQLGENDFRDLDTGYILPEMYELAYTGPETFLQWATRTFVTPEQYPWQQSQYPIHYEPLKLLARFSPHVPITDAIAYSEPLSDALRTFCRKGSCELSGLTVGDHIKEIWAFAEAKFQPFNSNETLDQWSQRTVTAIFVAKGMCTAPAFHRILNALDDWPHNVAISGIGAELTNIIEQNSDLRAADYENMTVNDVRNYLWSKAA
ncbi:hypothetical protein RYA05_03440 [Pseudomonas syringae pv. actinidiae]|nr:hypothetical protein [Pseudomonas syringae pv. actinidiae]